MATSLVLLALIGGQNRGARKGGPRNTPYNA